MEKQSLLNTAVNNITMSEAVDLITQMIDRRQKNYIVPINVDMVIKLEKDPLLKKIIDQADLTLVDGKPLIWISKLFKAPIKEKISGSDLVPELCKNAAEKGHRIFIIGGAAGVAERAVERLKLQYPNICIAGTYSPEFGFEKDPAELQNINALISQAHPDLLFVCFGCPKQEKWLYENYQKYDATVSVCAGATVDFLAGTVKRAPRWVSDIGFEWFYRFLQEPKRLFTRYFIDDIKILKLVLKYKKDGKQHE